MDSITSGSSAWVTVSVIFGLLEACLQAVLMKHFPFHPQGDEREYIQRGRSENPFLSELFHRVPVLPTVAWIGGRIGRETGALRLTSVASSVLAMAATAGAATRISGPVIASIICAILLLVPERAILGNRSWPDVELAAITSLIVLVLTLAPAPIDLQTSAVAIGCLVAIAVLTRVDALALVPAATVTWMIVTSSYSPSHLISIIGIPTAAFTAWWLGSVLALGERWPDTTWRFNLGITAQENVVQMTGEPVVIDDLILRYQGHAPVPDSDRRAPVWVTYPLSVVSRLRTMLGPDVFVSAKIIASCNCRSFDLSKKILDASLRLTSPLVFAITIAFMVTGSDEFFPLVIPAVSLLAPAILFHARTRFRLPLIYSTFLFLSFLVHGFVVGGETRNESVGALFLAVGLFIVLSLKPHRLER